MISTGAFSYYIIIIIIDAELKVTLSQKLLQGQHQSAMHPQIDSLHTNKRETFRAQQKNK